MAKTYIFLTDKQQSTTDMMNSFTPPAQLRYSIPPYTNTGTPIYIYMTQNGSDCAKVMPTLSPPAITIYSFPDYVVYYRKGDYPWTIATPSPDGLTVSMRLPDQLNHNLWILSNANDTDILTAQSASGTYCSVELPDVL